MVEVATQQSGRKGRNRGQEQGPTRRRACQEKFVYTSKRIEGEQADQSVFLDSPGWGCISTGLRCGSRQVDGLAVTIRQLTQNSYSGKTFCDGHMQ